MDPYIVVPVLCWLFRMSFYGYILATTDAAFSSLALGEGIGPEPREWACYTVVAVGAWFVWRALEFAAGLAFG